MYIIYTIPFFVIAFIALMIFGSYMTFMEWLRGIIYFWVDPAFIKFLLIKIGVFDILLPLITRLPKKEILKVFLLDAVKTFSLIRLFTLIMPLYRNCWASWGLRGFFISIVDLPIWTILVLFLLTSNLIADIMSLFFPFSRNKLVSGHRLLGLMSFPIICYAIYFLFRLLYDLFYFLVPILINFLS